MKKENLNGIALIVIFLLTIFGLFGYAIVTPSKAESVLENRKLAQRPDFTAERFLSGDYTKRFEQYYNDQFPERDFFIESNSMVNEKIFQQNVVKDVFIAKNGYLMSKVEKGTAADADKIAKRVNDFASAMDKKGVHVYTALMPNKTTMMEEQFPSYYPSFGQSNMDLLYPRLKDVAHPIDSRDALKKHMDENSLFFYTDHHWQAKAAFYAYQNVMSTIIKNEHMDEKVYDYNDYTWNLKGLPFYGSDARKTTKVAAKHQDRIMVAKLKGEYQPFQLKHGSVRRNDLYETKYLSIKDPYTNRYKTYLGGDFAHLTIENPNKKNGKNLLVIKDSYANAFIQFLVPHYKETHVLDLRHYKIPVAKFVEKHDIDQVIILNNVNSIYVTPSLTDFEHPGKGENQ